MPSALIPGPQLVAECVHIVRRCCCWCRRSWATNALSTGLRTCRRRCRCQAIALAGPRRAAPFNMLCQPLVWCVQITCRARCACFPGSQQRAVKKPLARREGADDHRGRADGGSAAPHRRACKLTRPHSSTPCTFVISFTTSLRTPEHASNTSGPALASPLLVRGRPQPWRALPSWRCVSRWPWRSAALLSVQSPPPHGAAARRSAHPVVGRPTTPARPACRPRFPGLHPKVLLRQ